MGSLVFFKYLFVSGCTASNIVFFEMQWAVCTASMKACFFKNAFVSFAFALF